MSESDCINVADAVRFLKESERAMQGTSGHYDISKQILGMEAAIDWIQQLPKAKTVQVVRCEDCHWLDRQNQRCRFFATFVSNMKLYCAAGRRENNA